MSKFIELTLYNVHGAGKTVYVPTDKIQLIRESSLGRVTFVWIDGIKAELEVIEGPAKIQRLIGEQEGWNSEVLN